MKKLSLSILFLCAALCVSAQRIRVACIGNSITWGSGIEDREHDTYPAQLQQLLGDEFQVENFGVSGATAQTEGDKPWVKTEQYQKAIDFLPQIAVIKLGTNDSKPQNWAGAERLVTNLEAIAQTFEQLGARVIIALPATAYKVMWGINDSTIANYELPALRRMAKRHRWPLVDLHKATARMPERFPDGIHPDAQGAGIIAGRIKKAVEKERRKLARK